MITSAQKLLMARAGVPSGGYTFGSTVVSVVIGQPPQEFVKYGYADYGLGSLISNDLVDDGNGGSYSIASYTSFYMSPMWMAASGDLECPDAASATALYNYINDNGLNLTLTDANSNSENLSVFSPSTNTISFFGSDIPFVFGSTGDYWTFAIE
jgi:hypothetical protein